VGFDAGVPVAISPEAQERAAGPVTRKISSPYRHQRPGCPRFFPLSVGGVLPACGASSRFAPDGHADALTLPSGPASPDKPQVDRHRHRRIDGQSGDPPAHGQKAADAWEPPRRPPAGPNPGGRALRRALGASIPTVVPAL